MARVKRAVVLAVIVGTLALAPSAFALPGLYVTYDGATITITTADGTSIATSTTAPGTTIPAGAYDLIFHDASGGPQVDIQGGGLMIHFFEPSDGTSSRNLPPSTTFTVHDDNFPSSPTYYFSTSSTVLATPTTTTAAPTGPPVTGTSIIGSAAHIASRGTLALGGASLTLAGKTVSSLAPGRYTVVLTDRSAKTAVTLARTGKAPVAETTAAFVGTRKAAVTLTAGTWSFVSGSTVHRFTVR